MSETRIYFESVVTCNISLEAVKDYLLSIGWVDDGVWGPYCRVFKKEFDGKEGMVQLLTTDKVGGYDRVMTALIRDISYFEKMPIQYILQAVSAEIITTDTVQSCRRGLIPWLDQ